MRQPNSLNIIFSMNTYTMFTSGADDMASTTTKCAPVLLYKMTDVLNWTSDMDVTPTELLAEHRLVLAGDFGRPGDAGGLTKNKKGSLGGCYKCPTDVSFLLSYIDMKYLGIQRVKPFPIIETVGVLSRSLVKFDEGTIHPP